jgi:hypothetical protein
MREYIDLILIFEAVGDIEKKGSDKRDAFQKLEDLINHPNTEPNIKNIAQRKLDYLKSKLAAEKKSSPNEILSMFHDFFEVINKFCGIGNNRYKFKSLQSIKSKNISI